MKRFSKDWWLELAITVIRDCELYKHDGGISLIQFNQTIEWDDDDCKIFSDYCFKRYAESYHRDYQLKEITHNYYVLLGREMERERILGIIESLKLKDLDLKTDYGQGVRHGYEILYDALIVQIKG